MLYAGISFQQKSPLLNITKAGTKIRQIYVATSPRCSTHCVQRLSARILKSFIRESQGFYFKKNICWVVGNILLQEIHYSLVHKSILKLLAMDFMLNHLSSLIHYSVNICSLLTTGTLKVDACRNIRYLNVN